MPRDFNNHDGKALTPDELEDMAELLIKIARRANSADDDQLHYIIGALQREAIFRRTTTLPPALEDRIADKIVERLTPLILGES